MNRVEAQSGMHRLIRRGLIGILAGSLASSALISSTVHATWCVALGVLVGAAYTMANRPARQAYVDNLMAAAALGLPLWGLTSVIAIPLLSGEMPQWGAHQMRSHFPALMGWVLYGALLGLFSQAFTDLATRIFGPETEDALPARPWKKRFLIPAAASPE